MHLKPLFIFLLALLFNQANCQIHQTYQQEGSVDYIDVSENGEYIASCDNNKDFRVKLIAFETGKIIKYFSGHHSGLSRVCISNKGKLIAAGSWDGEIIVWDIESGKIISKLIGHKKVVISIQFSKDETKVLSSSKDQTVKLWDISSSQTIKSFSTKSKRNSYANFSSDEKNIINGRGASNKKKDLGLLIWNVESGDMKSIQLEDQKNLHSASYSPNGKYIVCTNDLNYKCILLDANTFKVIRIFKGHTFWVYDFKFSPNMKYLFSCSHDKTIKIWNIENGKLEHTFIGHSKPIVSIDFGDNFKKLASSSVDKTIKIWNIPERLKLTNQH